MPKYRWDRPPQMRLRLYLVENDITQTWLAEATGLTATTVAGIMSGRVRATRRTRALIAQALGQPSGSLFEHIDDPTDDELVEAADAELWRTMPPIDDATLDCLRRLLFPQHARQTARTT